jgi:hypothetical protein
VKAREGSFGGLLSQRGSWKHPTHMRKGVRKGGGVRRERTRGQAARLWRQRSAGGTEARSGEQGRARVQAIAEASDRRAQASARGDRLMGRRVRVLTCGSEMAADDKGAHTREISKDLYNTEFKTWTKKNSWEA